MKRQMKRLKHFYRIVCYFFSYWRSPDFFGDPITAKTAWGVARIWTSKEPLRGIDDRKLS